MDSILNDLTDILDILSEGLPARAVFFVFKIKLSSYEFAGVIIYGYL